MPNVKVSTITEKLGRERRESNEIKIDIEFGSSQIEQDFKKSLVDSYSRAKLQRLKERGSPEACIDCLLHEDGKVSLIGLAEDINCALHSPPMILPDHIPKGSDKEREFWQTVGDVIYRDGKVQEFRDRDASLGRKVLRTFAHEQIYKEARANREKLAEQEHLNRFLSDLKEGQVGVFGRKFLTSTGELLPISSDFVEKVVASEPYQSDTELQTKFKELCQVLPWISVPDLGGTPGLGR